MKDVLISMSVIIQIYMFVHPIQTVSIQMEAMIVNANQDISVNISVY